MSIIFRMGSSLDCEDIKHEYVLVMANYWFGKSTLYKYIYICIETVRLSDRFSSNVFS